MLKISEITGPNGLPRQGSFIKILRWMILPFPRPSLNVRGEAIRINDVSKKAQQIFNEANKKITHLKALRP